jgi:hypothetical protein
MKLTTCCHLVQLLLSSINTSLPSTKFIISATHGFVSVTFKCYSLICFSFFQIVLSQRSQNQNCSFQLYPVAAFFSSLSSALTIDTASKWRQHTKCIKIINYHLHEAEYFIGANSRSACQEIPHLGQNLKVPECVN